MEEGEEEEEEQDNPDPVVEPERVFYPFDQYVQKFGVPDVQDEITEMAGINGVFVQASSRIRALKCEPDRVIP